jgi:hypothetical protein
MNDILDRIVFDMEKISAPVPRSVRLQALSPMARRLVGGAHAGDDVTRLIRTGGDATSVIRKDPTAAIPLVTRGTNAGDDVTRLIRTGGDATSVIRKDPTAAIPLVTRTSRPAPAKTEPIPDLTRYAVPEYIRKTPKASRPAVSAKKPLPPLPPPPPRLMPRRVNGPVYTSAYGGGYPQAYAPAWGGGYPQAYAPAYGGGYPQAYAPAYGGGYPQAYTPNWSSLRGPTPIGPRRAKLEIAEETPGFFSSNVGKGLLVGGGVGLAGAALYRGLRNASEQNARMNDYMGNAREDLNSPMPSLKIGASYEKLAARKLADTPRTVKAPPGFFQAAGMTAQNTALKSLTDSLAKKLIEGPLDAAYMGLKRRLSDEPAWQANFQNVVSSDPMLAQAHSENPAMLPDAFESIKRFSPSIAKDRLATKNLLKHVVLSGGELDHSIMKMLAETEKLHTESKKR